jgi:hypothetical protein
MQSYKRVEVLAEMRREGERDSAILLEHVLLRLRLA